MTKRTKTIIKMAAIIFTLLGTGPAYTGTICFNGTNILSITTPSPYRICQAKTRLIRFTVSTSPSYNGTTSFSTSSCALGIANLPTVNIVNGVGQITTNATGSTALAPGNYNCTVSVAAPNPSTVPTGGGCSDQFVGSTTTFTYTLKRAGTCN
jgi:hypothetical protein